MQWLSHKVLVSGYTALWSHSLPYTSMEILTMEILTQLWPHPSDLICPYSKSWEAKPLLFNPLCHFCCCCFFPRSSSGTISLVKLLFAGHSDTQQRHLLKKRPIWTLVYFSNEWNTFTHSLSLIGLGWTWSEKVSKPFEVELHHRFWNITFLRMSILFLASICHKYEIVGVKGPRL